MSDPLADILAAMDSVTTVVVVHPSDATAIRAAAVQPGVPPLEVVEDRLCPPGTAYTFPKTGGPLADFVLPWATS